jgi:hypothetical protein
MTIRGKQSIFAKGLNVAFQFIETDEPAELIPER